MNTQDPKKRIRNFEEVALGLTENEAMAEAKRCLNCKKAACIGGCPVEIDIPAFIQYIAKGEFDKALAKIREKNFLPAVCGRVCPQEDQCERVCVLNKKHMPVSIGDLERFVADWEIGKGLAGSRLGRNYSSSIVEEHNFALARTVNLARVAVIGSGPSGITCAGELAKMGYDVTLFESLHKPGGVLIYGIPEFRLPKSIVKADIGHVESVGVKIENNFLAGKTKTIDELKSEGYKAFFIGIGAGLPYFLDVEWESLNGIYSANEFLTRTNLMKGYLFPEYDTPVSVGESVGVIGAGNVAMDSARCALRLGAESVSIIYRRTEKEMPARLDEIHRAKEEGIKFELLTHATKFIGDEKGWLKETVLMRNELGESDASGRRRPVPIKGSEFTMKLDTVICAIGQGPNPLLPKTLPELKLNDKGNIAVDKEHMTSIAGVFAGGDIVTGAATVISAMGAGKRAAASIDRWLRKDFHPA